MLDSAAKIHFRLHSTKRPEGEQGRSDVQDSGDGRVPRVTQVMALAVQFQDMLSRAAFDLQDDSQLALATGGKLPLQLQDVLGPANK